MELIFSIFFNIMDISRLKELHSQGLSNRSIAKIMCVHWETIATHLRKNGLISNMKRIPINMVNEHNAKCSKCHKILPIEKFSTNRKNRKYTYTLTYCNKCRYRQWRENVNIEPFLKDKLARCRTRCTKFGLTFDLDHKYLVDIYNIVQGKCVYLGYTLDINIGSMRGTISMDRIDNSKGYIKGNVIVCSNKANSIKNDLTMDEFKTHLPSWYKRAQEVIEKWRTSTLV